MVYINESIDVNTALKNPSSLWVVCVGSNSFREISYAGKPQVVSSYILSNLCLYHLVSQLVETKILHLRSHTMGFTKSNISSLKKEYFLTSWEPNCWRFYFTFKIFKISEKCLINFQLSSTVNYTINYYHFCLVVMS